MSAIHDGFRYALGIESVYDLLDEVCRRYRAKEVRSVVICADFSTVSPLLRWKLLWYRAKSKGEFDVVLGGPAAWFSDASNYLIADRELYCYAKSKTTGCFALSDADQTPYFLRQNLQHALLNRPASKEENERS